ncbi:cytochrome P450 2G1-like [Hyperolius riggenbachi]|uniref:cytochrome P450 2G1-like n=1 Tax=Hyperolius riggenbachi TaxID=752182 RepID=UPI0035A2A364
MDLAWMCSLLLAVVISCLIYSSWNMMYKQRNLPPGPTPFPVVGNILHIKRGQLVKSLMEFAEKYGSVYTIYFGHNPVIVLAGYETVKEALVDRTEVFSGRGAMPTFDQFFQGYGLAFVNGERWKDLRRFSLTVLRNFGMGRKPVEERIQEEAGLLVERIRSCKEKSIDPTNFLLQAVSNIICTIVFGNRFEYDNKGFRQLLTLFSAIFKDISGPWGQLLDMLPGIMCYIPGPHKRIQTNLEKLEKFIFERVDMHKTTLDINSPRDYIDCFLIKQQMRDSPHFSTENLTKGIMNLFFAGTETITTTLRSAFLILVKYPEIQAKLHEEIDRVIGENHIPSTQDRSRMPYMDAVTHEVQRFSDILPLNLPHAVTQNTNFKGYIIPKGTVVYPLLCSVLHDPKEFSTPHKFNPDHFLDNNGCFKKNNAFMPFSAGKRVCSGESLARMEIFIYLAIILKNFTLTSETEFTEEDIKPRRTGFANAPMSYKISFIPRAVSL